LEHFLTHAVGARPLLLLLDGHSSHYQPRLFEYAREFCVIMFCLPPHTAHESHPLDASVFKSLKQNWQHMCHDFIQSNPSVTITTICSGFRRCGVYPFNPDAIDCSVSVVNPEATLQQAHVHSDPESYNENYCKKSQQPPVILSSDKLVLFQRRLREGFDIPDEEYMKWLKQDRPETFTEIYGGEIVSMSIADAFSDVPVASPVMIPDSELIGNGDVVENEMQNDPTATDDTGSSGCNDDSAFISNADQSNNAQSSDDNDVSNNDESASNIDKAQSSGDNDAQGTASNSNLTGTASCNNS